MSPDWSVRPARPADLDAMVRLQISTWRDDYAGWLGPDFFDAAFAHHVRERLTGFLAAGEPLRRTLVAERGGDFGGYVACGAARSHPGEVFSMYVERALRGRGLGAGLLAHAWDELAQRSLTPVTICVLARNEGALRFYQRLGAVETGRGWFDLNGRRLDEVELLLQARPGQAGR
jgi:ribosomal protein S18 acetylase RimI-like enzyme